MESNKVKVKIYGQEYVIAGEKTKEEIIQVAAHVDMKMQEVTEAAKAAGVVPSNIAVLSAVNIASEYFQVLEEMEELKRMNIQLEKDAQHYVQLWDESKKNYMDYKEETQAIVLQKDELLRQLKPQRRRLRAAWTKLSRRSRASARSLKTASSTFRWKTFN